MQGCLPGFVAGLLVALPCTQSVAVPPPVVVESPRRVPVAYEVDVVVVGGSTGGVSAAVAAAGAGARVFLAAPRPYAGDDMAATLRLWLDEGERPTTDLARRIFSRSYRHTVSPPSAVLSVARNGARFTYDADLPSAGVHKDSDPPSRLTDLRAGNSINESVQYDGYVTITCDLGAERPVKKIHLLAFQRPGNFDVAGATISVSGDKANWIQAAEIANSMTGKGQFESSALDLSANLSRDARYVRLRVKRAPGCDRLLLGEIVIEAEGEDRCVREPIDNRKKPPVPEAEQGDYLRQVTPMRVKAAVDDALLEASVEFLFNSHATDVLVDEAGQPAGIIMANRAGRQAVVGRVIIDATENAVVARAAGVEFPRSGKRTETFRRVVIGGEIRSGKGIRARTIPLTPGVVPPSHAGAEIIEYTLDIPISDDSFASLAAAEQLARDRTFHPGQLQAAERLQRVPPSAMKGRSRLSGSWPGAMAVDLGAFRPAGVEQVYVLSGWADVPREAAPKLLRPCELMAVGERIGRAAANEALNRSAPKGLKVKDRPAGTSINEGADVAEVLVGVRAAVTEQLPTVSSPSRHLPVLGQYDVVVIGGGTSGAPAGIGAARHGAKVLVVEFQYGLGGVGTLGLIGKYWHGFRGGFTAELDQGVAAMAKEATADESASAGKRSRKGTGVEMKMEWYRRELRKAGAEIWFGATGCGAIVRDGNVIGAVVSTPGGRGAVLAKTVIDATGNADIAHAAGAPCMFVDSSFLAMQGTGLSPRALGANYTNTDYTFAENSDMLDVWRLFVYARQRSRGSFDLSPLIDSRERRRIVGEKVVTISDIVCRRTYPDTIGRSQSNYDTHGYTVDPLFIVRAPHKSEMYAYTPYRALLPQRLDGLLVVGLGMSAHRDAVPILRMQPDLQNQGYAAGVAAAMAAELDGRTRSIDIRELQRHLVEVGNLPESVLSDEDSFPLPTDQIGEAVRTVHEDIEGAAVLLSHQSQALPLLREAYAAAIGEDKVTYALLLAVMGDATGGDALIAAVEDQPALDKGWNFRGMGQFGASMSRLDALILGLGLAGEKRAAPVIIEKLKLLDASSEFSHHRAIAVALEMLADRRAVAPLAELLSKPGMTGHVLHGPGVTDRSKALRELILARVLYRLGDHEHTGEQILRQYVNDVRGVYARHAHAVLDENK